MELFPAEAQTLRKIVDEWSQHSERELEATFGVKGEVDTTSFLTVAQRLKAKGFTALPQEDRLTITLTDNTRFTLNGLGVIQQYCRDDRIAGKPFVAMIKDRAGLESNLDLDDYDTRIKVRREIPLGADDARIKEIMTNWAQQKKAFRMIRRWTFQAQGVQFDLSMVRSTKKDLKGNYVWVRKFLDQDIMSQPATYEIEVELVRGPDTPTPEKALTALIRGIGEVLRGLQKCTLLIRKSVREKVLNEYKTLVNDDKFRGVAPITLEIKNMAKMIDPEVPNIRTGYNVTDKADGLRVLGFCNSRGELYMIDMALNVYRTGLRREACRGTLLDGEWVTKDKDENPIQQLMLFDIFFGLESKKVDNLPFYSFVADAPSRYNALKAWETAWNGGDGAQIIVAGLTPKTRLQVSVKSFLFAQKDEKQIFNMASQVLNKPTIYNTDGLIFTPNDTPLPEKSGVGFLEQFKWKPAEDNTIDFLVRTQKAADSKQDEIISAIKPGANDTIRYKTLRLYVGSSADPAYDNPRETILFDRPLPSGRPGKTKREYKPVPFNPKEFPDTMASVCNLEIQTDPDTNEEYVMTERSKEPIQDKSIVEMRYDPSQPPGWRWIPIRVRYDKTERLLRGILGRTLNSDKVADSVWNSIHDPITLTMIRTGSEQPSDAEMSAFAKTAEEREGIARRYYERKAPKQDLMLVKGLRDFHNRWVKENILLDTVLKGGNKSLMDTSVGKAADLQKWRRAGVGFVLGVDIAGEGIRDPNDGAYRRYLDTLVNARGAFVPPMIFVIGDSSKPIVNGSAGATEEEGDMLRSIFGRVAPQGPVPPFVSRVGAGKLAQGADVIASMFSLHYYFKDKDTWTGYLDNIRDSLKVGGYFIACFFDGQKVFELLEGLEKGEAKTGIENDAMIWSIKKEYDEEELPTDETAFGMAIDVEFISIGTSHREYLVPFKLLKDQMKSIGLDLINDVELAELGMQNSTNLFENSYAMAMQAGQKYPMSAVVKQYSFLNRWVIFRRYGTTPLDESVPAPMTLGVQTVAAANTTVKPNMGVSETTIVEEGVEAPPIAPTIAPTTVTVPKVTSTAWKDIPKTGYPELVAPSTLEPAVIPKEKPKTLIATKTIPGVMPMASDMMTDALVEAQRTLPVEKGIAAGPQQKYEASQVFVFYSDAALQDKLKIGDRGAARWLSPFAPFPIQDPTDPTVKYPTLEHYLAAMKYKYGTDQPQLAGSIFGEDGTIHQKYIRERLTATAGGSKPLTEEQDYELLRQEMVDVRNATRASNIKKYRAMLDETAWATKKDEVLRDGLKQRWERDARLRKIVETARAQEKYLLYHGAGTSDLGGVRRADGSIEGENKVGRILMELAGFPGFVQAATVATEAPTA